MSMTFEEYLKNADTGIQEKKNKKIQHANDTYAAAEAAAGTARDNAITYAAGEREREEEAATTGLSDATKAADERLRGSIAQADDTFERDKVTYGQAAERLAQAGLTGSGYSDNLTRDAFASRATLYADANRTNAAEKHAAEVTYRDAMAKAESDEAKAKYEAQATYDATVTEAAGIRDQAIYTAETDYDSDKLALEGEKVRYGEEKAAKMTEYIEGGYSEHTLADIDANFSPEDAAVIKETNMKAVYNDFVDELNYGSSTDIASAFEGIENLKNNGNIDQDTYDAIVKSAEKDPTFLAARYGAGRITSDEYISKMTEMGKATSKVVQGGWTISGLGSGGGGGGGDKIGITIGSTTDGADGVKKFELFAGDLVSAEMQKTLNEMVTGDPDKEPSTRWAFPAAIIGEGADSNNDPGRLLVYNGDMYLCTGLGGWRKCKSRGDKVEDAIAEYLRLTTYPVTMSKK